MVDIKVGDILNITHVGNCSSSYIHPITGYIALCVLDSGHSCQHIAVDFDRVVVEIWV